MLPFLGLLDFARDDTPHTAVGLSTAVGACSHDRAPRVDVSSALLANDVPDVSCALARALLAGEGEIDGASPVLDCLKVIAVAVAACLRLGRYFCHASLAASLALRAEDVHLVPVDGPVPRIRNVGKSRLGRREMPLVGFSALARYAGATENVRALRGTVTTVTRALIEFVSASGAFRPVSAGAESASHSICVAARRLGFCLLRVRQIDVDLKRSGSTHGFAQGHQVGVFRQILMRVRQRRRFLLHIRNIVGLLSFNLDAKCQLLLQAQLREVLARSIKFLEGHHVRHILLGDDLDRGVQRGRRGVENRAGNQHGCSCGDNDGLAAGRGGSCCGWCAGDRRRAIHRHAV